MSSSALAKHVPRKNGWRSNKSRIFHEHFSGWTPANRFCAELPPGARDWTSCSSQEGKVRTMCSAGEGDRHTRACRNPTPERIGVRWRAASHDGGCQGQRLGPDEPWAKEHIRKTRKRPVCPRFSPRDAIRGREQQLHEHFKAQGRSGNVNNPVGSRNANAQRYRDAANREFGPIDK